MKEAHVFSCAMRAPSDSGPAGGVAAEKGATPDCCRDADTVCGLTQDHLLDVLRPGLPDRTFRDGEILLRQGEQGTHLMYLLQGQVEVLVKLPPIRESSRCAPVAAMPGACILGQGT